MVEKINVPKGEVWSHIRTIRYEYLKRRLGIKTLNTIDKDGRSDSLCAHFVDQESIDENFQKLAKAVKVDNVSEEINKNVSKKNIDTGAEMFLALNACPTDLLRLYGKILSGSYSRIATLALNIIKNENKEFKPKTKKIFSKIVSLFGFQYIQNQKSENESSNVDIYMDASNVKGWTQNISYILLYSNILDKKILQQVSNHPVHIMNKDGKTSPTALIPFCSFGNHLTGVKAHGFNVPICNIFEPKVLYDQLCYETDLEKLRDKKDHKNLLNQLKVGLVLLLDYNEETNVDLKNDSKKEFNEKQIFYEDIDNPTSIFLDTIS